MARAPAEATVTVYSRPGCHLCEEAMATLRAMQADVAFTLTEVDISSDAQLLRAYFERIPVVCVDGEELCDYYVVENAVRERLESRR
jgi:glutaredoxin